MSNNIRIAIEVSRFIRRLAQNLFRDGSGVEIYDSGYLSDEQGVGIIDEFDPTTNEWEWANAVLMLLRTIHGILENAENEIDDDIV